MLPVFLLKHHLGTKVVEDGLDCQCYVFSFDFLKTAFASPNTHNCSTASSCLFEPLVERVDQPTIRKKHWHYINHCQEQTFEVFSRVVFTYIDNVKFSMNTQRFNRSLSSLCIRNNEEEKGK